MSTFSEENNDIEELFIAMDFNNCSFSDIILLEMENNKFRRKQQIFTCVFLFSYFYFIYLS